MSELSEEKKQELWDLVEDFIRKEEISCSESLFQRDSLQFKYPELLEKACDIVGYHFHANY